MGVSAGCVHRIPLVPVQEDLEGSLHSETQRSRTRQAGESSRPGDFARDDLTISVDNYLIFLWFAFQYRAVFEEKKAREDKMADLRARAANGDFKAKSELRRMEMSGADVQVEI